MPGTVNIMPPTGTNDVEAAEALRTAIEMEGPETVAAFIGEPVAITQFTIPDADYWPRVREICDEYGVLLIADETLTGLLPDRQVVGRSSAGASCPTCWSSRRPLSGGYAPVAAMVVREHVYEAFGDAARRRPSRATAATGRAPPPARRRFEVYDDERMDEVAEALGPDARSSGSSHFASDRSSGTSGGWGRGSRSSCTIRDGRVARARAARQLGRSPATSAACCSTTAAQRPGCPRGSFTSLRRSSRPTRTSTSFCRPSRPCSTGWRASFSGSLNASDARARDDRARPDRARRARSDDDARARVRRSGGYDVPSAAGASLRHYEFEQVEISISLAPPPLAVQPLSRQRRALATRRTAIRELEHFSPRGRERRSSTARSTGSAAIRVALAARREGHGPEHRAGNRRLRRAGASRRGSRVESIDELAARFAREITDGIDDTGIRAGIIGEIGTSGIDAASRTKDGNFTPAEEKVLRAAGTASNARAPRSPCTSIRAARAPFASCDVLAEEGVAPDRIVMGHMDAHPDLEYHLAIADRGVYVEYDHFGREYYSAHMNRSYTSDTRRIELLAAMLDAGLESRLLLSQDVCLKIDLRIVRRRGLRPYRRRTAAQTSSGRASPSTSSR